MNRNVIIGIVAVAVIILLAIFFWPGSTNVPTGDSAPQVSPAPTN